MVLLRPVKVTHVLTFEEKTRVINFFRLLVEIDIRLPKTTKSKTKTKAKTEKCEVQGKHKSVKPACAKATAVREKPCCMKCPAMCSPLRTAQRDLYLVLIYSLEFLRDYLCLNKKRIKWIDVPN